LVRSRRSTADARTRDGRPALTSSLDEPPTGNAWAEPGRAPTAWTRPNRRGNRCSVTGVDRQPTGKGGTSSRQKNVNNPESILPAVSLRPNTFETVPPSTFYRYFPPTSLAAFPGIHAGVLYEAIAAMREDQTLRHDHRRHTCNIRRHGLYNSRPSANRRRTGSRSAKLPPGPPSASSGRPGLNNRQLTAEERRNTITKTLARRPSSPQPPRRPG